MSLADGTGLNNGAVKYSKTDGKIWWEEIGRTTLTSPADVISLASIPARKYLRVVVYTSATGGTTNTYMRFNNDSGNNYSERSLEDGSNINQVSINAILIAGQTNTAPAHATAEIVNIASQEKTCLITGMRSVLGAANVPVGSKNGWGKWANTSALINRIDIVNQGTGDFAVGSELIVLGHD
ncbi:hypothetical protein MPC38_06815 [Prescottella equi]|uniref:hypothetical protein n=1 Tax=Rhodococcus hoagii TaxID=43767 RepID=UPI001F5BEE78|nr:hypothetical protein [Prescottella equi]UNQ40957.1 hypothetical protein MPC38_06815 [Prescottella equi]